MAIAYPNFANLEQTELRNVDKDAVASLGGMTVQGVRYNAIYTVTTNDLSALPVKGGIMPGFEVELVACYIENVVHSPALDTEGLNVTITGFQPMTQAALDSATTGSA